MSLRCRDRQIEGIVFVNSGFERAYKTAVDNCAQVESGFRLRKGSAQERIESLHGRGGATVLFRVSEHKKREDEVDLDRDGFVTMRVDECTCWCKPYCGSEIGSSVQTNRSHESRTGLNGAQALRK